MTSPLISVVMPVYNGEKYLNEAIDSILSQTFTDFEFIILNDGSTDRTEKIILSYDDSRIRYVKNKSNLQIVKTLNKGISLAKGKYIARMDADDISLSNRLEMQFQFMEKNKDIDICGTWMKSINNLTKIWKYPVQHEAIKSFMIFNSPVPHPTTFMRLSFFDNLRYEEEYNKAEDYHLWYQAIVSKKFYNLPIALYQYRIHNEMTTVMAQQTQERIANRLRLEMLKRAEIFPNDEEIKLHIDFSLLNLDLKNINETCKWLKKILIINAKSKYFNDIELKKVIGEYWWQLFNKNAHFGLLVYKAFMLSSIRFYYRVSIKDNIKFLIKCIIKYT